MKIDMRRFGLLASLGVCLGLSPAYGASKVPIPPPEFDAQLAAAPANQTAVFAGGCFWGTQAVFERVKGVIQTTVGYSGGSAATATYAQVTTETTGHAESVEIVSIHPELLTVNYSASSSLLHTIPRNSTARDRTLARPIAPRSFM
jgi:peptide-methionine (S)-S-oxide reductase